MSNCICPSHHVLDKDGYPRVKYQGKLWRLNRLTYYLCFGEIPNGMVVCHRCNNKGCVNPDHLYLSTPKQNSTDAARDMLYRLGERHPKAKRTKEEVNTMRAMYDEGMSQTDIGKVFGITQSRVSEIVRRKFWKHI